LFWLVILGAALLGLLAGVGVALRGRSLGPSATSDASSRPTFVIAASRSPAPAASPSPVVVAPTGSAEYVVQPGDTLRSIALKIYADADEWRRIYDANRDVIGPDPDTLLAGTRLRLP
jgi:nucleoid-associated protein YgaU